MKNLIKEALDDYNKEQMQARVKQLIADTLTSALTCDEFIYKTGKKQWIFKNIRFRYYNLNYYPITLKNKELSVRLTLETATVVEPEFRDGVSEAFYEITCLQSYFMERLYKLLYLNIDEIELEITNGQLTKYLFLRR